LLLTGLTKLLGELVGFISGFGSEFAVGDGLGDVAIGVGGLGFSAIVSEDDGLAGAIAFSNELPIFDPWQAVRK
jgi:hypothetical protein